MRLKWPIAQLTIYCLLISSVSYAITAGLVHHEKSTAGPIKSSTSQVVTTAQHLYTLGETGPGGGTVFYHSAIPFTETGATCAANCHYLEWAPNTWSGGTGDPQLAWSSYLTNLSSANGTAFGIGYSNTTAMLTSNGSYVADPSGAAYAVHTYAGTDSSEGQWFLPSQDELNAIYTSTIEPSGGFTVEPRAGSIAGLYWSSSEYSVGSAWAQAFSNGTQYGSSEGGADYVRPIRAF